MNHQILPYQSVRFFPSWDQNNIYLTVGLINMVDYILSINPNANLWLELGSHIGESATIFLSFEKIEKLHCVEYSKDLIPILQQRLGEEIRRERCVLHLETTINYAKIVDNNFFDVIYIDADHSYDSVQKEISLYWPKVKHGGFLSGHDYYEPAWPGVVKAVNEFSTDIKLPIKIFKDYSWVIHKE